MELTYTIKRSQKRKKVTITVDRDRSVLVHAPLNASVEAIEQVIQAKRSWIYEKIKHPQKYEDLPHPPGKELVNGESVLYLGRQFRIEIVDDVDEIVRLEDSIRIASNSSEHRRVALRDWYINAAEAAVLPRVERHARRFGVSPTSAKIVDNRYRWGSCTADDGIRINWRVIKAPVYVIDYIIVHELAHMLVQNHTQEFWGIVRAHSASMDKAREWLRNLGQLLEEDI